MSPVTTAALVIDVIFVIPGFRALVHELHVKQLVRSSSAINFSYKINRHWPLCEALLQISGYATHQEFAPLRGDTIRQNVKTNANSVRNCRKTESLPIAHLSVKMG
jgi:hypothetical protein